MKLPAVVVVLLSLAISACADRVRVSDATSGNVASPQAASIETRSGGAQKPIALGRLPDRGFAVSSKKGTLFLDASGRVLREVPHLLSAGNPGAGGLWFEMNGSYLRLHVEGDELRPVSRDLTEGTMYDEGSRPSLAIPPNALRVDGRLIGGWRFAIRSPTRHVLALWSGECEVPTAYWIPPGGEPRIITGETNTGASPDSVPLGWAPDGRAFAWVGRTACGSQEGSPPGIYAFTSPGVSDLVYRMPRDARVEMWGA